MQNIKQKTLVPPGGVWFYMIPELEAHVESRASLSDCIAKVRRLYGINNIDVPENLDALVEDHICRHIPDGFCEGEETEGAVKNKPFGFFAISRYTETMLRKVQAMARFQEVYVDQREAERRASICIGCPMHSVETCIGCNGLRAFAAKFIANRTSKYDKVLRNCGVCGCVLTSKIHIKSEILAQVEDKINETPACCWMREQNNGD